MGNSGSGMTLHLTPAAIVREVEKVVARKRSSD
jgi:hypothetical protein